MLKIGDIVTNGNTFKHGKETMFYLFEIQGETVNEFWVKPLNGKFIEDGNLTFKKKFLFMYTKS